MLEDLPTMVAGHRKALESDEPSWHPQAVAEQVGSPEISPRWWQRHGPVAVLVAAFTLVIFWRLVDLFYYSNDDFLQFFAASRSGLSSDLVWMNVFGHVAPFNRLGHGTTLWMFGLDPNGGALLVSGLIWCVLASTAWLTFEVGLSLMRRLLVVTVVGGSEVLLFVALWCDGAWHALPCLTATYVVAALHLRGVRTGKARWHLLSVIVFAIGLLAQERTGFAIPLVILIDVLLLWRHRPWPYRFRGLWSVRWPLLAMSALAAITAWLAYRKGVGPGTEDAFRNTLKTMLDAFTVHFFPQLAGLPATTATPSLPFRLGVLAVIAALGVGLTLWNSNNAGPVLFIPTVFAMFWGFLLFDPMLHTVDVPAIAGGLGYAIYPFVPAVIAVFCLELPIVSASIARMTARQRLVAGALIVALVAGWQLTTTGAFAESSLDPQRQSHRFFATADSSRQLWSDPAVTVVPVQAPLSITSTWALDYGRQEFLLNLIEPRWSAGGDLTARTVILDPTGTVRDVALLPMTGPLTPPDAASGAGSCWSGAAAGGGETFHYKVGDTAIGGTNFLRATYSAESTGQLSVSSSTGVATLPAPWPIATNPGTHTVLIALPTAIVDAVDLSFTPTEPGKFCLQPPEVVSPVLVGDGECQAVDQYGQPAGRAPCPGER